MRFYGSLGLKPEASQYRQLVLSSHFIWCTLSFQCLRSLILVRVNFVSKGTAVNVWRHYSYYNWGRGVLVFTTNHSRAQSVKSAEGEKPSFKHPANPREKGLANLAWAPMQPGACFCVAHRLGMVSVFSSGWRKDKKILSLHIWWCEICMKFKFQCL